MHACDCPSNILRYIIASACRSIVAAAHTRTLRRCVKHSPEAMKLRANGPPASCQRFFHNPIHGMRVVGLRVYSGACS